jgi:hypothetical protein
VVAALEAVELSRRRYQQEKQLRLEWCKILSEEVFRWWRSFVAQLPEQLSPADIFQIQSAFRGQLRAKIDELARTVALPLEEQFVARCRDKVIQFGRRLFKIWRHVAIPSSENVRAQVLIASECEEPRGCSCQLC